MKEIKLNHPHRDVSGGRIIRAFAMQSVALHIDMFLERELSWVLQEVVGPIDTEIRLGCGWRGW